MSKFRLRLIEALNYSGLTQLELSDYLGVHKTVVNSWIKGKAKLPNDIDKITTIAVFLGVNPSWLAGFDEPIKRIKISDSEIKLIESFRQLSEPNQNLVLNTINALPKDEKNLREKLV